MSSCEIRECGPGLRRAIRATASRGDAFGRPLYSKSGRGSASPLRRWKRLEVEMQQHAFWRGALFAALTGIAASSADAQNYPDRPVKIISDSGPGGPGGFGLAHH